MLERLRDKVPVVRAQSARALSRLQDGGESNDFSEDAITAAFIQLLGAEKNKDVRKAILGSLAISDHTIPYVVGVKGGGGVKGVGPSIDRSVRRDISRRTSLKDAVSHPRRWSRVRRYDDDDDV